MNWLTARRTKVLMVAGALCASTTLGFITVPASAQNAPPSQSDVDRGMAALEEGRGHLEAGRWSAAARAFEEALLYLPENADAQAGLAQAQTMLDEGSTIETPRPPSAVLLQRARIEFDDALSRATQLLGQEDFDTAEREVLTAQLRMQQNRDLFAPQRIQSEAGTGRCPAPAHRYRPRRSSPPE